MTDEQTRPYTFNIQPFVADKNTVQQGYLTSEPYAIEKAGVKANTLPVRRLWLPRVLDHGLLHGQDREGTQGRRRRLRQGDRAEGWKSYLANPAPGNALIKKDNPNMTDDQLAYSVAKLKEMGMVTGGDAAKLGIGVMTDARRRRATTSWSRPSWSIRPRSSSSKTYTTEFVKDVEGPAVMRNGRRRTGAGRAGSAMPAVEVLSAREDLSRTARTRCSRSTSPSPRASS